MTETPNIEQPKYGIVAAAATALDGASQQQCPTEGAGDLSYAEKLRARLDYLEDWYFHPQKFDTKISQWEVKELRTHRPYLWTKESPESTVHGPQSGDGSADQGSAAEVGGGHRPAATEMVVPSYVESAAELAQVLDTYFRERISIEISPTVVGQWRKGLRVGQVFIDGKKVIPPSLPKNKSGNRFVTQPCIDWVEKWIVPQKAVDSHGLRVDGGAGAPGSAMDFDRIKQEHAIWQMQREKDLSDGKFKSVEVFNQHIAALFSAINRALNAAEKDLQKGKTPEAMMETIRAAIIREVNAAKESDGNVVE